jgi:hypothetical protein
VVSCSINCCCFAAATLDSTKFISNRSHHDVKNNSALFELWANVKWQHLRAMLDDDRDLVVLPAYCEHVSRGIKWKTWMSGQARDARLIAYIFFSCGILWKRFCDTILQAFLENKFLNKIFSLWKNLSKFFHLYHDSAIFIPNFFIIKH